MSRVFLFVLLLPSLVIFTEAQDCALPSQVAVEQLLRDEITAGGGDPIATTISGGPDYTCQVQGTTMGTYQELSVIMEYNRNDDRVGQFEMTCSNGNWFRTQDSLTILSIGPGVTYNGSFGLRTDCSSCTNMDNPNNNNNCQTCNPACNVGLRRCTGSGSGKCCPAFENGNCRSDLNCSGTNFVATAQNNFTCDCNLTSCDPGYSITTNSSGCYCVLSDICMTQPSPCNNSGSCILNASSPDNFTCDCNGTGYTGDTCDEAVPTTTTMTTTTVTSSSSSSAAPVVMTTTATTSTIPVVIAPMVTSTTSSSASVSPSVSQTPKESPTTKPLTQDELSWPVIIISIILAILLLIILIILILYIIYYCITGRGSNMAKAKANTPFANGESHNNPLYLKPDEVTSEVANLYTPDP